MKIARCIFLLSIFSPSEAADGLDVALFEAIFPVSSNKCTSLSNSSSQNTTYTFKYEESPSNWSKEAAQLEKDLFIAEMSHTESENANKSWTFRVGQGGNIYSFRGAYGEAVPPQNHPGSIFVDEVAQSVAVHMNKAQIGQYYVQQAGGYLDEHDDSESPVFSPTIAHHCRDNECSFASWGQKADIRTDPRSNIIYFNNYKDCGDGVIQFTSVIYNTGNVDGRGAEVSYLNVPWSGVRQSTLRDTFISSPDGHMHLDYPPKYFTPGKESTYNPNQTGGFTTFTEEVIVPENIYNKYPFKLPDDMRIILSEGNPGRYSQSNSALMHRYCMYVNIVAVHEHSGGCLDCDLQFRSKRTGNNIEVRIVLHWAWGGSKLYFCPENVEVQQFNSLFQKGDEIIVSRRNVGKSKEDNLALTFVHGFQSSLEERYASSRIRWGKCGDLSRDYTVFTCNTRVPVKAGDAYFYQQYLFTGRLADTEKTASKWVNEVHEDLFHLGELKGKDILLYSINAETFGIHTEGQNSCSQGVERCQGKSAPEYGLNALFAINCGDEHYVGFNKYYFAPLNPNSNKFMTFKCKHSPPDIRPEWKLLGFFENGQCGFLTKASYDSDFCSTPMGAIS